MCDHCVSMGAHVCSVNESTETKERYMKLVCMSTHKIT